VCKLQILNTALNKKFCNSREEEEEEEERERERERERETYKLKE